MYNYREKYTCLIFTYLRIKPCIFYFGFFFLSPGIVFSSANLTLAPTIEQQTSIRSFHETTELAEIIWTDLTNHFISYYESGDYKNAHLVAQRAYNIANKNFTPNNVNTADALLKLGIIKQTLGSLGEAENLLLKALLILEKNLGLNHPDLAVIMTNLGNVYFESKHDKLSEKYHQQALKIRKNAFSKDDPAIAQSIYNLAVLYESQHQYEQAEIFYQQAISSWSASMGATHPYVSNALDNLSNVYNKQGKHKKATGILQRMLALKKTIFGSQHEEVAQTLINLGLNYLEQGAYNPASHAYEEALDIAQHVLGSSDPQLALLMYTLANIYHTQARIEGKNHTSFEVSTIPANNASIPMNTAQRQTALFAQALPLYEKAAEILDAGENETQPVLDIVLTELAMLYKEIGNIDMAQAIESRIAAH